MSSKREKLKGEGAALFVMRVFRFFILFSFLFLICVPLFCEEETNTEEAWILAAQKFELQENRNYSKAIESAASVIPQLVLEQISRDTTRTVFRDEQVAKKIDSLFNERLSLFLELSKEVKARDALVLNNYTMFEYESALKNQEKKIKAVKEKIDKNLEEQQSVLFPDSAKRKNRKMLKAWEPQTKPIALYNGNSESLFVPSESAKDNGIESREFSREIASAKISGLIYGSMVAYGDYVSITAELYIFPGAKKVGVVSEIGTLSDVRQIAENIAFKLLPKIANGIPVEIEFNIFPEEAKKTATLTIDNIVYTPLPEKVTVSSGLHSVSIDADNYKRESFLYDFSGSSSFLLEVAFREESTGSVKLALSKFVSGNIFFDGKFVGESSRTDFITVPLKVNGRTVFGYFEGTLQDKTAPNGERAETMFVMIPPELMFDGAELETKVTVFDVGKNIDKRRKRLYLAYSSLLVGLPFMFYSYGRFTSYQRGFVNSYGNVSYADVEHYRKMSLVGIGVVSACGVWMLTELILYLKAVDKTLPPKAKKVKSRTLRKMEMEREREKAVAETDAETEAETEKEIKNTEGQEK